MIFHFYNRKKGLIPNLIRYFAGGTFNHVSIEVDRHVYEALGGRLLGTNGVVMSPDKLSYHRDRVAPDEVVSVQVTPNNEKVIEDYLRKRVGLKYDTKGALGFAFRWLRGGEHSYFCSELGIRCLELATGTQYDLRYSPSALYELIKNQQ